MLSQMYAYLDPATGSMMGAALVAGGAGLVVLVRMYWHRFIGLFSKKHRAQADELAEQLTGEHEDETDDDAPETDAVDTDLTQDQPEDVGA
jgi:hypothetical protein